MHASIAEREQSRTFHCAKIQLFFGLEYENQVFLHKIWKFGIKDTILHRKIGKTEGYREIIKTLCLCISALSEYLGQNRHSLSPLSPRCHT